MKHQALFSSKGNSKTINVSSAAIWLGSLRIKNDADVLANSVYHDPSPVVQN